MTGRPALSRRTTIGWPMRPTPIQATLISVPLFEGPTMGVYAVRLAFPSVSIGDRQMLSGKQRDDLAGFVGDHYLFLDTRRRITVRRRTVGLKRKDHAGFDFHRVIHRDEARDDRPFMQSQPETVSELQAECAHFVGKA